MRNTITVYFIIPQVISHLNFFLSTIELALAVWSRDLVLNGYRNMITGDIVRNGNWNGSPRGKSIMDKSSTCSLTFRHNECKNYTQPYCEDTLWCQAKWCFVGEECERARRSKLDGNWFSYGVCGSPMCFSSELHTE